MTQEPEFQGKIGKTLKDSDPWWPPVPSSHDGKTPNVVIMLFDDTGFGHFGCYGSTIETPHIDKLAAGGRQYTNFHTTALCSPTRASLLTGRNHHAVGMRGIADYDPGFPNMRAAVTRHAATLGEMLRDEGYATFAVGKWHLNPKEERSAAGPFTDWPLQRGFNRYYGFLGGATDQFYPDLTEDNHHVNPPKTPEQGYHLNEDLIDHSIDFVRNNKSIYPNQPFFLYLAFGATHSPHQAPESYLEKYKGKFDHGWDAVRDEWFARQIESGIIPEGTQLAPRNPGVDAWDDLSDGAKKLACKLQEAFAGFLDHTDDQIGRLITYLDRAGEIDNTIILLMADNGASQEGGPQGISAGERYSHPYLDDLDNIDEVLPDIGTPRSDPNYPWGWAQAGNTPLKWYKSTTHAGGVRDPLLVHWPEGIKNIGGVRHQFTHVTDIVPTLLDVLDISPKDSYQGYPQMPIPDNSFAYTFDDPDVSTDRGPQYFEMFGHRAIWADGWKAVARHVKNDPISDAEWELYHLDEDFSECNNLAETDPEKLRELIDLWWIEAGKNGVLPIDDRSFQLTGISKKPGGIHDGLKYHYTPPVDRLPGSIAPPLGMGEWTLDAEIERSNSDEEGVIFARGSHTSGLSLYVKDNRLQFDYNCFTEILTGTSQRELPAGECTVSARFEGEGIGGEGRVTLLVDGDEVGVLNIPLIMRGLGSTGSVASIGGDELSPTTTSYDAPFYFAGTIHTVDVEIKIYETGARLVKGNAGDIYSSNLKKD